MDATELAYAGAARQAQLIRDGEVSSREVVQAHLERIERLDGQLNAFRVVFAERALAEAKSADRRKRDRGPLHGVPVAIKDDVDVEGEPTAWGTSAHDGPKPADAEVVRRLRAGGAIVLGKTSVPEMTIWPFTETLTFGATRNPWSPDHTPGGSSGGTGAAVAAGLVGIGLGSDGAGSIRIPSAWCHLFGIKPQRGRVPIAPHDDAWQGMSVNGPMARRVADAALFLDVASGGDGAFAAAAAAPEGKLRIAISTKLPPGTVARVGAEQRAALDRTAEVLRSLGHDVVERDPDYGPQAWQQVLQRYLRGIRDDVATMPHPERLERRTRGMARMGALVSDTRIAKVRAAEAAVAARVNTIFDHVDVLLTPGTAGPPFKVGAFQGRSALVTLNAVAARVPFQGVFNATGQPGANLPAGLDSQGRPLGVQAIAAPHGEEVLVKLGAQLEQATGWADRRPPVD
jgi:amidase